MIYCIIAKAIGQLSCKRKKKQRAMKKDKKELIAIRALELFAIQGYDNTSISDLQYSLDMGRGTLYYYYKDKDELFADVLDRYFLTPKQRCLELPDTVTIHQMIDALLKYLYSLEALVGEFEHQNLNTSNVISLMHSAYNRFPDLYRKANRIYIKENELWKRALQNEIREGIIRDDIPIDTVATMFTHIKDGFDTAKTGMLMDFSIFPKQYNFLYDVLKITK